MKRHTLSDLSDNLLSMTDWNNKEEVLEAVKEDGYAFKQASEELRADKNVVLVAVI